MQGKGLQTTYWLEGKLGVSSKSFCGDAQDADHD